MDISYVQEHFVPNVWDFCDQCSNKININWKCVQCQQFLCEACYNSHVNGRITREHVIFSKDEKDKEPELLGIYKCKQHADRNITMYCTEDLVPICSKCVTQEHRGHIIDELEVAADKMREELRRAIDKWYEGGSCLHAIEKAERNMTDYNIKRIKVIHEMMTELRVKSPQIFRNLINDLEIERQSMIQDFAEMKFKLFLDIKRGEDNIADINHALKYLRDGEIIRKGQEMLRKIKVSEMKGVERYKTSLEIDREELKKKLLMQIQDSETNDDTQLSTYMFGLSCIEYIICIYIGSDKTSVCLHNRLTDRIPVHFQDLRLWIDEESNIVHFEDIHFQKNYRSFDVEKEMEDAHLICTLQPVSRNGEVYFESMDGKQFGARKLFQSIFKNLMSKGERAIRQIWSYLPRETGIILVYSETLRKVMQFLCHGLHEQESILTYNSDVQDCVDFHSSILDHNAATQWLVVHVGYSTTISVHRNNDSQALFTPVVCSGLMEIADRWIYIFKSILGESPSSSQLDTDSFKLHLLTVLIRKVKQNKIKEIRIQINDLDLDRSIMKTFKKSLKTSVYQKHVSIKRSHMVLSKQLFQQQIDEVLKVICSNISYVLALRNTSEPPFLLLVNEHGPIDIITKVIKSSFPDLDVKEMNSEELVDCIAVKITKTMCWNKHSADLDI